MPHIPALWYFDTSVTYPQWFRRVKVVVIPPCFAWQQYLWNIAIQPAVGCYNSWVNLRCWGCLPLGERLLWNRYVAVTWRKKIGYRKSSPSNGSQGDILYSMSDIASLTYTTVQPSIKLHPETFKCRDDPLGILAATEITVGLEKMCTGITEISVGLGNDDLSWESILQYLPSICKIHWSLVTHISGEYIDMK